MKSSAKLTKLEREWILTNAEIASCIGYWVEEFITVKYSPIDKPDYRILSITAKLEYDAPEGMAGKTVTIDHKTIQKGVDAIFMEDGYGYIKSAIINDDHDIETTDVIIQFGLFGELVYS